MNKPMDWEQLLNRERFYWPRDLEETKRPKDDDILDVFQVDCSRITLSPPFHRLQRKTQVLPFPRTDYPRTRLTHTNEVSDCGRQIARLVGMKLANEGIIRNEEINSIEDIVAAACKAHDIGNPPFGHAGEFAIRNWISQNTVGYSQAQGPTSGAYVISDRLREEYLKFDGNAQGFRLLTETTGWRRKGGLQLTCAVLGAFSKYPWTVGQGDKAKYGVMGSSVDLARYAFDRCGLITCAEDAEDVIRYARHPLVYIVEAADDISYLTADLEDAVKAKVVPSNKEAFGFLDDIAKSAISDRHERKNLMRRADQISEGDRAAKLRYLKDHAQRALKITAADTFYDNYERIIQGQMVGDLLDNSPAKDRRTAIQDFFKNEVYDDVGKVRNEIFGVTVIEGLLGFFFDALTSAKEYSNAYSVPLEIIQKRLNIFPLDNYFGSDALEQDQIINTVGSLSEDDIAKMVVDYISGMTDTYATDIFQQIYGLQRPSSTW